MMGVNLVIWSVQAYVEVVSAINFIKDHVSVH